MHNVLRVLLVGLVFITPLFVIPTEYLFGLGKPLFVVIVMALTAIVWIVAELRRGKLSIPRHMVVVSLAALVVITAASSIVDSLRMNAIFSFERVDSLLYVLICTALAYLVAHAFRNRSEIFRVLLALGAIPAVLVVFEVIKVLLGSSISTSLISLPTFIPLGSWNEFGLLCGLGTILSAAVLTSIRKRTVLWGIFFVFLVLSLVGLVIVNMQFAWIMVGIFATLLFVYMFAFPLQRAADVTSESGDKSAENRRAMPVLPIVLIIISFVFILLSRQTNPFAMFASVPGFSRLSSFAVYNAEARPSFMTTVSIGTQSLKNGQVLGTGPGKFSEAWSMFKPAEINQTTLWAADFDVGYSTALGSFVTLGVLGLLSWIFITVSVLLLAFRSVMKSGTMVDRGVSFAIVIAVVYSLAVAWTYPIGLAWLIILFFLIGLLLAHGRNAGTIREREYSYIRDPRVAFAAVLGLVLALLAVLSLGYIASTQAIAGWSSLKAQAALSNSQLDEAVMYAGRALAFSPTDRMMRVVTDIHLARLNEYVNEINAQTPQGEEGELSQAVQQQFQAYIQAPVQSASQAVALNDRDVTNWVALGNVYRSLVSLRVVEQAYEEGVKAYTQAQELSPRNPGILLAQAGLERAKGDDEAAFRKIDEAIALKPDYTDAYFLRAQIHIDNDSLDEAIAAAELGALSARTSPVAYLQVGILKFNNNDFNGAAGALEQALVIDPQFANAQYYLARSYYELGRRDEARTLFEQLAETNPDSEDVKVYLDRLNGSGGTAVTPSDDEDEEEESNS